MSDYTPSMDELRATWIEGMLSVRPGHDYAALWDRAMAAHDAEVRRAALLEAAQIVETEGELWSGSPAHGFFGTADAIREEADR